MRIVLVTAFLNNVFQTTVIEMVEMVEILDGRLGKHSVERVRYVINNLLHLVIVKYGVISLYFVFPLSFARDNTVATHEISHHNFTLTRVISLIYIYTDTNPITLPCSLVRGVKI